MGISQGVSCAVGECPQLTPVAPRQVRHVCWHIRVAEGGTNWSSFLVTSSIFVIHQCFQRISKQARCTWLGRGCQVWLDKNLQIFRGTRKGDAAYLMIINCWIIVDFFHLRSPQPMKKCCSLRRAEGASSVSLLITWSASTFLSKHKARKSFRDSTVSWHGFCVSATASQDWPCPW